MSARNRFEIVRTAAGWHARIVAAANGKTVWWTENYTRRRAAVAAIRSLTDDEIRDVDLRGRG